MVLGALFSYLLLLLIGCSVFYLRWWRRATQFWSRRGVTQPENMSVSFRQKFLFYGSKSLRHEMWTHLWGVIHNIMYTGPRWDLSHCNRVYCCLLSTLRTCTVNRYIIPIFHQQFWLSVKWPLGSIWKRRTFHDVLLENYENCKAKGKGLFGTYWMFSAKPILIIRDLDLAQHIKSKLRLLLISSWPSKKCQLSCKSLLNYTPTALTLW